MQKLLPLLVLFFGLSFAYSPDFFINVSTTFVPEEWGFTMRVFFAEPFAMPALILPFLMGVGLWISRAFLGKSRESYLLLWLIAILPSFAFGYDSFVRPYLHKNFGWKCDDCEMRAFFKDKIGEKAWFSNFEVFKTSPLKMCNDLGKKSYVQIGDVQTFVIMLTKNIDWLQMQVEQKEFNPSASDNIILKEAYNKIFKVINFQKNNLVSCWSGSSSQYIDEIDKLLKVQRQLYNQLMSGASA